jgi:hypothetical protein
VAKYKSMAFSEIPSAGAAPSYNLVSAIRARYAQPSPLVLKILSTLAVPQQAMIGAIEEVVNRSAHPYASKTSIGQAMLQGVADPGTSFTRIPGISKAEGIALDIAADPMWVLGGPLSKGMTVGARSLGRVGGAALTKYPKLDYAVGRALTKVKPNWAKERAGYKGFDTVATEARMAENEVRHALIDNFNLDLAKEIPDAARRRHLDELSEIATPERLRMPRPLDEKELVLLDQEAGKYMQGMAAKIEDGKRMLAAVSREKLAHIAALTRAEGAVKAASIAEFSRIEKAIDSLRLKQVEVLDQYKTMAAERARRTFRFRNRMAAIEEKIAAAMKVETPGTVLAGSGVPRAGGTTYRVWPPSKKLFAELEKAKQAWLNYSDEFTKREVAIRKRFATLEKERQGLAKERARRLAELRGVPRGRKRTAATSALAKEIQTLDRSESLARSFEVQGKANVALQDARKEIASIGKEIRGVQGSADAEAIYRARNQWAAQYENIIKQEEAVMGVLGKTKDEANLSMLMALTMQTKHADAVRAAHLIKTTNWLKHVQHIDNEVAALSSVEQKWFNKIRNERLPLMRKYREEMGGLDPKVSARFEESTGLSYVPRIRPRRDSIVADLDESLARYGSTWSPEQVESFKLFRNSIAAADVNPSESYIREMQRRYMQGRTVTPGFTKFREIRRSVRALRESPKMQDQVLYALIEKDIASNLHQASVETARAVYRHMYIESFRKWMTKNNLLVKAEDVGKLPPGVYGKGPREMVPIDNVPELKGYYGPRVLVEDLHDMVMSPLDPQKVKDSLSALRKMNGWFRGWALSAPMTVVRNAADSLVWRNIAAGANPVKDMPHWFMAGNILRDAGRGALNSTEKLVGGKTAAEWFKEFVRAGTVRSNVYEETRMMSRGAGKRFLYAHTNPYGKFLMDNFEKVEDVARSGMYMWKRSQGLSPEDAMRFTNKWHIDYRHGLTQWERNVRDRFIPFYTFTRFNVPLAIETLIHHPRLTAAAGHAMDTWEDVAGIPDEDFPLGGWMASGTPLKVRYDEKTGTYMIFMLDGWWSFTDLNKLDPGRLIDNYISMVTPFLTTPYEVIKNHKLFPSAAAGQKIERPGDRFEMFGKSAEFPFDKRLEAVIRIFRPLNEADQWLKAASAKYGDSAIERGKNAVARMLLGNIYPTTREDQVRFIKAATDEQLRALYSARKRLEANGESTEEVQERIDNIKQVRKDLDIK